MPKWEYFVIEEVYVNQGVLGGGRKVEAEMFDNNGKKVRMPIQQLITSMGENGWELTGCGTLTSGNAHSLYFKRLKTGGV